VVTPRIADKPHYVNLWFPGMASFITAGTAAATEQAAGASELAIVEVSGSDRGATLRFDVPPSDIGDAWIGLDTSLETYELETTGVYRQILTPQGGVVLQAPVKEHSAAC
jgi:hypothetical protein